MAAPMEVSDFDSLDGFDDDGDSEDGASDIEECINLVTSYFRQNFGKNKQIDDSGPGVSVHDVIIEESAFDLNEQDDPDVPTQSIDDIQQNIFTIDKNPGTSQINQQNFAKNKSNKKLSTELDPGMAITSYIDFDKEIIDQRLHRNNKQTNKEPSKLLRDKCVIPDDIERKDALPKYGKVQLSKMRKDAREATKGRDWFDMPKADMTPELRRDLEALKMRHVFDTKRFYKNNDYKKKALPKFVQVARVVETAADFYSSRIPKKDRKKSIVDELLADTQMIRKNKRKYLEIQQEKMRAGKKARKHSKRLKKRSR